MPIINRFLLISTVLLLILSASVCAVQITDLEENDISTEEFQLAQNVPVIINGKTITLLDEGMNEAYIQVDDTRGSVIYTDFQYINGVSIKLLGIWDANQYRNLSVDVNITNYGSCGDGICHDREICCKDCGCPNGKACIDNQCIQNTSNECFNDNQCLDKNSCTIDRCIGVPRKCSHTSVSDCISKDGCCPGTCTVNSDSDCTNQKIECYTDQDCSEGKRCSGITHLCHAAENKVNTNEKVCLTDEECDDSNPCTQETCRIGQCLYGRVTDCASPEAQIEAAISSFKFGDIGIFLILGAEILIILFLLYDKE